MANLRMMAGALLLTAGGALAQPAAPPSGPLQARIRQVPR